MLGDHLKHRMELYGHPADPGTIQSLMTAAEKGIDVDGIYVDGENGNSKVLSTLSQFGTIPCLKDGDFIVYGARAVMSYLDDKGFGTSLVPRNGVIRAQQYKWMQIADDYLRPHAISLLGKAGDLEGAKEAVKPFASALDVQLADPKRKGSFIVGDYSLADVYWAAYVHMFEVAGGSSAFCAHPNVQAWWDEVKSHPSTSKEPIVAYEILPSMADIQQRQLKSIYINT